MTDTALWQKIAQEILSPHFDPSKRHVGWLRSVRIGLQGSKEPEQVKAHDKLAAYLKERKR
jgi:hypothetical protein